MSRYLFKCELRCEVNVLMGFQDSKGCFLEVTRVGAAPGQGYSQYIYSSIDDPFYADDDLDYCREKLAKLGLVVPESMYRAVEEDATRSKRFAEHFSDGRIIER